MTTGNKPCKTRAFFNEPFCQSLAPEPTPSKHISPYPFLFFCYVFSFVYVFFSFYHLFLVVLVLLFLRALFIPSFSNVLLSLHVTPHLSFPPCCFVRPPCPPPRPEPQYTPNHSLSYFLFSLFLNISPHPVGKQSSQLSMK